jgi:hypothetical protein
MAFLPYVDPTEIKNPIIKERLVSAMETGTPGPEPMSLRANHPWFARWWYESRKLFIEEGLLESELRELMRVRISTTWESMMGLSGCHY